MPRSYVLWHESVALGPSPMINANVSWNMLKNSNIIIPPRPVQDEIVAQYDKLERYRELLVGLQNQLDKSLI